MKTIPRYSNDLEIRIYHAREYRFTVPMTLVSNSRRIARIAYERLLAPMGSRALEEMLSDGLPPRIAPALRFLFTGQVPAVAKDAALQIERLRAQIAAQ